MTTMSLVRVTPRAASRYARPGSLDPRKVCLWAAAVGFCLTFWATAIWLLFG